MSDKLKKIFIDDDMGLLNVTKRAKTQSSSDRLESSFLAIIDFYNEHGREPSANTTDISERKLGVGLRGIRLDDEKAELLKHLDTHGLLTGGDLPESIEQIFKDDDLGIFDDPTGILNIKNIPKKVVAAEYKAQQRKCENFAEFEPLFAKMQNELRQGTYTPIEFVGEQSIVQGEFFVLKGLVVYVESKSDIFVNKNVKKDARLRLIYENGNESDVLMRTLARELYRNGRRIAVKSNEIVNDDTDTGYIYILKSLSDDAKIANVNNLFKVGFSTSVVEKRIANAVNDPTYLMADVEVVASYKTFNMNTQKFESLLHRIFKDAQLSVEMTTKDGSRYTPVEWYVVPLDVIDVAIRMIISGDITHYHYDMHTTSLELTERE
jgi:hypothetical protein